MVSHSVLQSKLTFEAKKKSLMVTSLLAMPVMAQAAGGDPGQAVSNLEKEAMETIIVTARQTKEDFSEIPFTINVMEENFLKKRGLLNIKDAIRSVPGVDLNDTGGPSQNGIRIRGVGSLYLANRDDTSVSIAIDGIPTATDHLFMSIFDVAQLEVLKGPQGSVYGRNSEAGAINITTNRPTENFEARFHGRYGEDSNYLAEGVVSGPLAEGFKGRLAVQKTGADHWVDNLNTGKPLTDMSKLASRGQLLWDTTDTSVMLTAEYHQAKGGVGIQMLRPYRDQPVMSVAPERFKGNEKNVKRLALNIEHEFEFAKLTLVTAHTDYDISNEVSFDAILNQALFGFNGESSQNQKVDDTTVSQDIRLSSLQDASVFWTVGANYWKSEHDYQAITPGRPGSSTTEVESVNYGIYGEVTLPLSERLKLTLGARFSQDDKDFTGIYDLGEFTITDLRSLDDNYTTGRVALSYELSEATNIYIVNSYGYKAGGFNEYAVQPVDSVPFKAAEVKSYEAGFKSVNTEYNYRLNGAVFYNDVENDHVLGFNPTNFASNVLNADTESFGAELEVRWLPVEELTLSAAVSYVDTEITTDVSGVYGGDVKAGNDTPDTPKWSGNLGIDWSYPLSSNLLGSSTAFDASLSYRYQGERAADPQNNFKLGSYSKFDLQFGLSNSSARVYLWADNLLDEQYELYGFGFGFPGGETGVPARGRSAGVGVEFEIL